MIETILLFLMVIAALPLVVTGLGLLITMKRLIVILFLIPSLAFGAFTEFYCDTTNGNNLNGGSSTATLLPASFTFTNQQVGTSSNPQAFIYTNILHL